MKMDETRTENLMDLIFSALEETDTELIVPFAIVIDDDEEEETFEEDFEEN